MTSAIAIGSSALYAPIFTIPAVAVGLYAAQKFANNTIYKSYKDLAFVVKRKGKNMKIYQDAVRPDLLREMAGLDKREKYGFLQLQALVRNVKI